jgi:hypothetical protein
MTGTLHIKFNKYLLVPESYLLQGTNANINLHPTGCAYVQAEYLLCGWQQLVPGLVGNIDMLHIKDLEHL